MNIFKKLFCKQNKPIELVEIDMNNNHAGCVECLGVYDKCKKEHFVTTKESQDIMNSKVYFEVGNHGF